VKFVWDFFEKDPREWGEIEDGVYGVREGGWVVPSYGHIIFSLQITNKDKISSFVIEYHGSSCETGGKLSIDKLQLVCDLGNVLYEFPNLHLDPSMIMKSSDLIITNDTMMEPSRDYSSSRKLRPPSNPQKLPPLPTLRRTTGIVKLSKTILDATKNIHIIPHCTSCPN
tara:strand:- start:127 stop:633 length:507 start_codon:yes stop_codon:yes gene_type:complete